MSPYIHCTQKSAVFTSHCQSETAIIDSSIVPSVHTRALAQRSLNWARRQRIKASATLHGPRMRPESMAACFLPLWLCFRCQGCQSEGQAPLFVPLSAPPFLAASSVSSARRSLYTWHMHNKVTGVKCQKQRNACEECCIGYDMHDYSSSR